MTVQISGMTVPPDIIYRGCGQFSSADRTPIDVCGVRMRGLLHVK
jgi:hypothetical protein